MAKSSTKKAEPEVDETSGLNALAPDMPQFEVEGHQYKMTRLGLTHAMMALRIFSAASSGIMKMSTVKGMQNNPMNVALAILSAMPYAENHVKDLVVASIRKADEEGNYIPITTAYLDDPENFPLESLITIIEGFGKHPDLKVFIKNIERLQQTPLWEEIQNRTGAEKAQPNDSKNN